VAAPTREHAWELLREWTETDSLRKHALAVEASMRAYAAHWDAEAELYGITGLLHDLDYERHPDPESGHPRMALAELRERGYPKEMTLYGVDELSGFVMACALVRPTGIEGMGVKSVRKKLRQPSFAAKVDRGQIDRGIAELGVEPAEHIQRVIDALSGQADELGLRQ
jgi:predicted hydrolase (HD superfamily)